MRELAIILGAPLVLFGFMVWGIAALSEKECSIHAQSFEYEWTFIGGCMVKHNNKWLPLKSIRGFEEEK